MTLKRRHRRKRHTFILFHIAVASEIFFNGVMKYNAGNSCCTCLLCLQNVLILEITVFSAQTAPFCRRRRRRGCSWRRPCLRPSRGTCSRVQPIPAPPAPASPAPVRSGRAGTAGATRSRCARGRNPQTAGITGFGSSAPVRMTRINTAWLCLKPTNSTLGPVHTGRRAPCNRRSKLWNALWPMWVFTQLAGNIKGFVRKFVCKCAYASCVNGP